MYVSIQRLFARMQFVSKYTPGLCLGFVLALFTRTGYGQDDLTPLPLPDIFRAQSPLEAEPGSMPATPSGPRTEFGDSVQDGLLFGDQLSGRTGQAYGTLFRAGVWTGPAVGRVDTIVPLEIMPYGFINNAMVFGSLRGFRAASDGWGMNLGGGIRYYSEKWDRIWGANAFYDYDNSSGGLFREVGFGFESLGQLLDVRANAYIPHATVERLLSTELVQGSQRFVGHQLLYDNLLTFGNALRGADWEVGIPIPGRIPQRHDLKVFAGGYHYNGTSVQGFTGWKVRAQANVVQNLSVQLEVLDDKVFDTSVVFGATWTYGGFRQPEDQKRTQFDRMTEMVRRNYNVAVARIPVIDKDKIAINPLTNNPYFFEHVASYAPTLDADGTAEHPWQTLTQASDALNVVIPDPVDQRGNIIYVHANSVYSTAPDNLVTLIPGVRILGEGTYRVSNTVNPDVKHTVRITGLGNVLLPKSPLAKADPITYVNRPIFTRQVGDAVTLVSGDAAAPSEFSGFQIGDPTVPASGPSGRGIVGDAVGNVVVNQTDVNFAQDDGIFLNAINGPVTMNGTVVNNIGAPLNEIALHITNMANGGQFFFGRETNTGRTSRINHEVPVGVLGGYALNIDTTAAGSLIDMQNSDIFDGELGPPVRRGGGILLNDINGQAILNNMTIVNANGDGVELTGGTGRVSFVGNTTVNAALADSIHIHDSNTFINFTPSTPNAQITIIDRNRIGLNIHNNPGLSGSSILVFEPITINASTTAIPQVAFPALAYESNGANVLFAPLQAATSSISITGGGRDGINIGVAGENSGSFSVRGTTIIDQISGVSLNIGNPLTIVSPGALLPLPAPIPATGLVNFDAINIDNRDGIGIQIQHMSNSINFQNTTVVANNSNSTATAVLIHDNYYYNVGSGGIAGTGDPFNPPAVASDRIAGDIRFENLTIEGTLGGGPNNAAGLDIEGLDPSPAGGPATGNRTSVTASILNINRTTLNTGSGTALFVNNAGTRPAVISLATASTPPSDGLTSSTGSINSDQGRAVVIQNSTVGVNLTSVSANGSPANGIFLSNNVNSGSKVNPDGSTVHATTFNVRGTGAIGSGGVITASSIDGVYILNSEEVTLGNLRITGNTENGIYANTPGLVVNASQVDTNGRYGINVYAVAVPSTPTNRTLQKTTPFLTLQNSIVRNNGAQLNGSQEVLFSASRTGDYIVTLIGNTISHNRTAAVPTNIMDNNVPGQVADAPASNDGVLIRTITGAQGARLFLSALDNSISIANPLNSIASPRFSAMNIRWYGPVASGYVQGNAFNFGTDEGDGLVINLESVNASEQGSEFRIAGNTFNSAQGFYTRGIDVTTAGAPASILIGNLDGFGGNQMTFVVPNGNPNLNTNNRTSEVAMNFNIDANSDVRVFNNSISMTTPTNVLSQYGLLFASVTAPNTGITISGNVITMADPSLGNFSAISRGIEFQQVIVGPPPQLQRVALSGTLSNDISINGVRNSTSPWFNVPLNPLTLFNGQVIVNGTPVP